MLIFDVDNKQYVQNVNLPTLPEPAATVLIENLTSLLEKKEAFVSTTNTSRDKLVHIVMRFFRWSIIGRMRH